MEIKVKIKQINRYAITIGEVTDDTFVKVGEWNGMSEFRSPSKGSVIVHNPNGSLSLLDYFMINGDEKDKDVEVDVVKISPSLVPVDG